MEILYKKDEQKFIQEQQQDYIDRLEQIRQLKIDQLRSEGVPEKYIQNLINKKFKIK